MEPVEAKVTSNGQISLPATVRHRWAAARVLVIDRGSYAIVRPIPDDIVDALHGKYADDGPPTEAARSAERVIESAHERRKAHR